MGQLGSDDVPLTSSTGARRRLVQMMVQLPAHDLVAAHCRQLEASDKQQLATFDEFWES